MQNVRCLELFIFYVFFISWITSSRTTSFCIFFLMCLLSIELKLLFHTFVYFFLRTRGHRTQLNIVSIGWDHSKIQLIRFVVSTVCVCFILLIFCEEMIDACPFRAFYSRKISCICVYHKRKLSQWIGIYFVSQHCNLGRNSMIDHPKHLYKTSNLV